MGRYHTAHATRGATAKSGIKGCHIKAREHNVDLPVERRRCTPSATWSRLEAAAAERTRRGEGARPRSPCPQMAHSPVQAVRRNMASFASALALGSPGECPYWRGAVQTARDRRWQLLMRLGMGCLAPRKHADGATRPTEQGLFFRIFGFFGVRIEGSTGPFFRARAVTHTKRAFQLPAPPPLTQRIAMEVDVVAKYVGQKIALVRWCSGGDREDFKALVSAGYDDTVRIAPPRMTGSTSPRAHPRVHRLARSPCLACGLWRYRMMSEVPSRSDGGSSGIRHWSRRCRWRARSRGWRYGKCVAHPVPSPSRRRFTKPPPLLLV